MAASAHRYRVSWDLPCFLAALSGMSGTMAGDRLLDLLEPGWRREFRAGAVAGRLEVEPGLAQAVATALGEQSRALTAGEVAERWPACVVVGIARIAAEAGTASAPGPVAFWPAWHRAAGLRPSGRSAREWGSAFLAALGALGLQPAGRTAEDAVLAHAAAPEGHNEASSGIAGGVGRARLDPFGGGVLLTDDISGQARSAPPEEIAAEGGRLLAFDENGSTRGRGAPRRGRLGALPGERRTAVRRLGPDPHDEHAPAGLAWLAARPAWT